MNLQNKKRVLVFILIILCVTGIGFLLNALSKVSKRDTGKNIFGSQILPPGTPSNVETYRGIVTKGTKGYNTYTSKKYGIQFSFPEEWRGGSGYLGYGSVSLFNYPVSEEPDFALSGTDGKNHIQVSLGPEDSYAKIGEQITIAGQPASRLAKSRTEPDFANGKDTLDYFISIPNSYNQLNFTMYGDPLNFYILDEMVRTVTWIPAE